MGAYFGKIKPDVQLYEASGRKIMHLGVLPNNNKNVELSISCTMVTTNVNEQYLLVVSPSPSEKGKG